MSDSIDRQNLLDTFGLSEKTRKYGGDHSGYDTMMLYEIQDVIENAPTSKTEKALRLLVEWAVECDFGYDNIPEEYEKYKDEIETQDMGYTEGLIYIAEREVEHETD